MGIGFYLSIGMLPVMFILTIIFFLKGKIKNEETKVYSCMLFFSILMTLFEILSALLFKMNFDSFIYRIIAKLVLLSYVSIFFFFCYYIMNICCCKKIKFIIFYIFTFIIFLVILFTSTTYVNVGNQVAPQGVPIICTYIYSICIGIYELVLAIINKNKIITKKFMPLYAFLVLGTINTLIIYLYPTSFMVGYIICLVIIIMYFTIENPDMKMLSELHKSKEISDSANEEKTIFLYNMTQEIRGITGKIDDDADVILDSKDYDEIYDNARDIKANTAKFTNITNDILDVSNVDSSTIKVYTEKYNIKNILKQLVSVYGELCKNKNLKFVTNIDNNMPEVLYGDSIGLKEILNVILKNSVKYTNKGFVELDVNTVIKNDICRLIITVEDSGIGIKSEDINNLKVSNTSLAKANKLATMMNGALLLSSDYGIGTKIKIILDQKMDTDVDSEVSKYESVFENINILSVDDSEAGHKIIDKLLKGTNIKLDIVTTGKECLDKLKVNKYNLILLDEELEEMTGIELMKKMKETRNFKIPVIFLTKNNSYEYNEEYVKAGFSDYLLKPLKKEELIKMINMYTKKDKK